jgi:hypothetical protein
VAPSTMTDTRARISPGLRLPCRRRASMSLASAPGTVRGVHDDMTDVLQGTPGAPDVSDRECGNGVVVSHSGDCETQYCHKNNDLSLSTPGRASRRASYWDRSACPVRPSSPMSTCPCARTARPSIPLRRTLVQRHSDLALGRHEELAHLHVDAVAVSCVAAGFCKSPLRRFSRRR